jgi:hypothetical protein
MQVHFRSKDGEAITRRMKKQGEMLAPLPTLADNHCNLPPLRQMGSDITIFMALRC